MAQKKTYTQAVLDVICKHLEMRACDPWDDELWPAANTVLQKISQELRDMQRDIADQAWRQFQTHKKGCTHG